MEGEEPKIDRSPHGDIDKEIEKLLPLIKDLPLNEQRDILTQLEGIFGGLTNYLERQDRFKRVQKDYENISTWMLAIASGTVWIMFWFLSSFNKSESSFNYNPIISITLNKVSIPNKPLFFVVFFFLGFSTLIFAISRLLLYLRNLLLNEAYDHSDSIASKIALGKITTASGIAERTIRSVRLWHAGHNLVPLIYYACLGGFIFYVIGLATLIIYIIYFVIYLL